MGARGQFRGIQEAEAGAIAMAIVAPGAWGLSPPEVWLAGSRKEDPQEADSNIIR